MIHEHTGFENKTLAERLQSSRRMFGFLPHENGPGQIMVKSWRVRRLLGKPVNLIGGEAFALGQMTAASIAGMPQTFFMSHIHASRNLITA